MAKNKKILVLGLVFCAIAIFAAYPNNGNAQPIIGQPATPTSTNGGLVPCGNGSDPTNRCTLCHFIIGFQNLVNYGLWIVIALAFVGLFFAGVMYVISSGDEGMITKAKSFLKSSLIGFLVVAGAWMIVNTTLRVISQSETGHNIGITGASWHTFTCTP